MGKLYELLAVEPSLKSEAMQGIAQIKKLFAEGGNKLVGKIRTYAPTNEEGEALPDEITNLATTVNIEIAELEMSFGKWLDTAIQKEITNQVTLANVVIGGKTLMENLPAPALLNLESKLMELRQVYVAIPTNDPSERWIFDEQLGCFVSEIRQTQRSKKVPRSHILYEATKEHPAQVQTYTEDVSVGTWTTIVHSGMLTPVEKQARLSRIDTLYRAVKEARQRANDTEIKPLEVAKVLFDFINRE